MMHMIVLPSHQFNEKFLYSPAANETLGSVYRIGLYVFLPLLISSLKAQAKLEIDTDLLMKFKQITINNRIIEDDLFNVHAATVHADFWSASSELKTVN